MSLKHPIRVSFQDFWTGFSPHAFFIPLVAQATDREVIVTKSSESDIAFFSVFKRRPLLNSIANRMNLNVNGDKALQKSVLKPGQRRVWYTGENQRPPLENFDLTLSFDRDSLGGTNVYLPLLITQLDWFQNGYQQLSLESRRAGAVATPEVAKTRRTSNVSEREKFLCAFIGNTEPMRMRALEALSSYKQVDVFGSAVGKPVPCKATIAKDYRFMLSFENDLYPGYVTEKPLDAWISGCIPLWRGIDQSTILNPSSIINAASFDSLNSFIERVIRVDNSLEDLRQIGSEPLLDPDVSLEKVFEALERITHG